MWRIGAVIHGSMAVAWAWLRANFSPVGFLFILIPLVGIGVLLHIEDAHKARLSARHATGPMATSCSPEPTAGDRGKPARCEPPTSAAPRPVIAHVPKHLPSAWPAPATPSRVCAEPEALVIENPATVVSRRVTAVPAPSHRATEDARRGIAPSTREAPRPETPMAPAPPPSSRPPIPRQSARSIIELSPMTPSTAPSASGRPGALTPRDTGAAPQVPPALAPANARQATQSSGASHSPRLAPIPPAHPELPQESDGRPQPNASAASTSQRPPFPPSKTTAASVLGQSTQAGEDASGPSRPPTASVSPSVPSIDGTVGPRVETPYPMTPVTPCPATRRPSSRTSLVEVPGPLPVQPPPPRNRAFGMDVDDVPPAIAPHFGQPRVQGAAITAVPPNSAGALAGLHVGDIIVELNGQPVSSAGELCRRLDSLRPGTVARIAVRWPTAVYVIDRRTRTSVRPRYGTVYHLGLRVP